MLLLAWRMTTSTFGLALGIGGLLGHLTFGGVALLSHVFDKNVLYLLSGSSPLTSCYVPNSLEDLSGRGNHDALHKKPPV